MLDIQPIPSSFPKKDPCCGKFPVHDFPWWLLGINLPILSSSVTALRRSRPINLLFILSKCQYVYPRDGYLNLKLIIFHDSRIHDLIFSRVLFQYDLSLRSPCSNRVSLSRLHLHNYKAQPITLIFIILPFYNTTSLILHYRISLHAKHGIFILQIFCINSFIFSSLSILYIATHNLTFYISSHTLHSFIPNSIW